MKYRFQFHGGFKDCEVIAGDPQSTDSEADLKTYLFLTDHGRVGTRFSERKPFEQEIQKRVFERLTKPSGLRSKELDRLAGPSTPHDIFFSNLKSKDQMRAADDLLTYDYQVVRRETVEDEIIVHLDCVRDPTVE